MASEEIDAIRRASEGLEYPSETDAPFEVMEWGTQEPAELKSGKDVSVDQFFKELEGSDQGEKFRALREALQKQLKGLRIVRIEARAPRIDVYLVGRTASGKWAGLHTISVET